MLAADLGAGALRVAAVSWDGRILAQVAAPLTIAEPAPGWAEADADHWWAAFGDAAARVLAAVPDARPAAVCLTGMTRSQVLLDADGRCLRPAILWRDRRAAGHAPHAFHAQARLAWLQQHEPAVAARVARVLEPKDFLGFRLTGLADAPTPCRVLGPVASGPVARLRGVPVVAGGMDTWAASVGAGACWPGQAYDVAGTSEAAGLLVAAPCEVEGLVTLPWTEDAAQVGGPTQAGGDAVRWAFDLVRHDGTLEQAVARAGSLAPRPDLPLFLPYLAGERAPVWRDDVRGALHGLARDHGPDAVLRSVMEGVAFAVRDILDTAARGTGTAPSELRIGGGGARSDAWCQIKADVLGLPVLRGAEPEAGLVGCAMAAAVGLGRHATLAAAAEHMVRVERAFLPDAGLAGVIAERHARWQRLKTFALA